MSRWPLLLLVLCTCALGLAACGGDDADKGDNASVATILAETFGEGKQVKSGRLDLGLKLNIQGSQQLGGPVSLRLNGPFQSSGSEALPQFDFQAAIDAGGQQFKAGAVSTAKAGFIRFQDGVYAVPADLFKQFQDGYAEQVRCNAKQKGKEGVSFAALGIRPARWLKSPKKAGTDKVGGTATTHITGGIDVALFLEDINRVLGRTDPAQADPCADAPQQPAKQGARQLSATERKQIADAIKDARVDIWTGAKDRTLRRMNVTLKFAVPEADRQAAGGLTGGDVAFDMTIGALNKPQTIKAPSGARPLEELTQALGGALPQGSGSGSGTSGSGTSGSDSGAASGSKYDQCLAAAGQDVTKLQECKDLIGQ